MPGDDRLYVGHMLDLATSIRDKTHRLARADFDADENLRLALAHLLQTIGEAARHVSPGFRETHPEIPWHAIVAMRHRVVHDYMNVDEDVVWKTATAEIPPLLEQLSRLNPPEQL